MPIRARSHILEEESIRQFSDALPSGWVYRIKTPDYGIDGEVEIFDADGNPTGLTFNIQLRATDDASRANRVRLEIDELDYYCSLDIPTAVVRYGSPEQSLFWQWAMNIASRTEIAEGQKTVTYRFNDDERWNEDTPDAIRRTLEVRRSIASYPAHRAVPLRVDLSAIATADRYAITRSIARAIANSRGALVRAGDSPADVEAFVRLESAFLAVGIDTITSVTFDLEDPTSDDYLASILYALTRIFSRQRLPRQAKALASLLAEQKLPHHNQELAIGVCTALSDDLSALVQLAIVNGFHNGGPEQAMIAGIIAKSTRNREVRSNAMGEFFDATLAAAEAHGPISQAAVHYSIGSAYRIENAFSLAVYHYNRARRLRPIYLRTGYFVREIASVFFMTGHYAAALKAYREAARLDPDDTNLAFLLGDAYLLSGAVAEARDHFEASLLVCSSQRKSREAELKILICNRLIADHQTTLVPRRRMGANQILHPDGSDSPEQLEIVLNEIDALHPLAHFNLGVTRSRELNHEAALKHFLCCAFVQPQDIEAWTNAAISGLNVGDEELLVQILSSAIFHMGADAYDRLRGHLAAHGMEAEELTKLDEAAMRLLDEGENEGDSGFTIRMLDGDGYQEMTVI